MRTLPRPLRRALRRLRRRRLATEEPAPASRREWIDQLRPRWLEVVRPFDPEAEPLFSDTPTLRPEHLANCRVLPSREYMVAEHLPKGGRVVEVGTDRGAFAALLLRETRPRELHIIDLSFSRLERAPLEAALADGRVILHEGDSAGCLERLPDESFDWIYIDANHGYGGVRRDIEAAKRKLRPDGLLVFNDYIYWSHIELEQYGVVRAVNELCLDDGWEFVYLALQPQMYCDVAVRRMAPR